MSTDCTGHHDWRRWALTVGVAAALVTALLVGMALTTQTAAADGTTLYVPGDSNTIQGAIDLAANGDQIFIAPGDYNEHLLITKTLTLIGQWEITPTEQPAPTRVVAGDSGRALTVLPGEVTPTVTISNMVFALGNASGLGGAIPPDVRVVATGSAVSQAALGEADRQATLAALQAALQAPGAFPGGQAALDEALARIAALTAAGGTLAASPGDFQPARSDIDCGGGIYANSTPLRLNNVRLVNNVASKTGDGAGGGLCAINMPADGLLLSGVSASFNVASTNAKGYGGGIYYDGAMQELNAASATEAAAGGLQASDLSIHDNKASTAGEGYGGGMFIVHAPETTFDLAIFSANEATSGGLIGYGGGMFLGQSNIITLTTVGFVSNVANTLMNVNDPTTEWIIGMGGAIYGSYVTNLAITGPANDATARPRFVGNTGTVRGLGRGGALLLDNALGLRVEHADFNGNWGAIYLDGNGDVAYGGAIALIGGLAATIADSTFDRNIAAVYNLGQFYVSGGAVDVSGSQSVIIRDSKFQFNGASTSAQPGLSSGGAVRFYDVRVGYIYDNEFTENVAELGYTGGMGGAMDLQIVQQISVVRNTFLRNRGGASVGIGGALTVEGTTVKRSAASAQGALPTVNTQVVVANNLFRDNSAALAPSANEAALGGAIAVNRTNGLLVANNVLDHNTGKNGAALALLGYDVEQAAPPEVFPAEITNNTLVQNPGAEGVYMEMWTTPLTLTNNIVVSHTVGLNVVSGASGPMTAVAQYNLYNENGKNTEVDDDSTLTETHVITAPVLFADRALGDYHLTQPSPAIEAGDPAGVPPAPPMDFDWIPRPYAVRVDIGAFEWVGPLNYLPTVRKEACVFPELAGWALGVARVGSGASVLYTADGGMTWAEQFTSTVELDGLSAVSAQVAWVSGDNNTLLHTMDKGLTWQAQALPANLPAGSSISRVTAVSPQLAWASAMTGTADARVAYILHTTNGISWTVQTTIPTGAGLVSSISAADANNVWVVGGYSASLASATAAAAGFILHSSDGGATWRTELQTTGDQIIIGVDAVNANIAWAAGRRTVYRTLNGGAKWDQYELFAFDANHISSVGGQYVWASGDAMVVMYTDKGLSTTLSNNDWSSRTPPGIGRKVAYSVDFVDAKRGWIAGGDFGGTPGGVILRTCNGGLNWELQEWSELDPIYVVDMIP